MKFRFPKKRRYRVVIYAVSTVLVLYAVDLVWIRVWRHVTVAKNTTYITQPLRPDGMPDYIQYLDSRAREGVTKENNAFIPFVEAFDCLPSEVKDETSRRLGISPAPGRPANIQSFAAYMYRSGPQANDLITTHGAEQKFVMSHPWSPLDHPDIAAWLAASEMHLAALQRIAARTRWYAPLISPPDGRLFSTRLYRVAILRDLTYLALVRAMRDARSGQFEEAEADILACHRAARLQAGGISMFETLVATAIEDSTLRAEVALAQLLPAADLQAFRASLEVLPPMPSMALALEGERLSNLDLLLYSAQDPAKFAREAEPLLHPVVAMNPNPPTTGPAGGWTYDYDHWSEIRPLLNQLRPAHYNAALQFVNSVFDRFAADASETLGRREATLRVIERDLDQAQHAQNNLFSDPARSLALLQLRLGKAVEMNDVHIERTSLTNVALALAAYREANHEYPDALAVLSPEFLKEVPADLFTGQPLIYHKASGGFLLYSVGPNLKDDGGIEHDENHYIQDDVVIRLGEPASASRPVP